MAANRADPAQRPNQISKFMPKIERLTENESLTSFKSWKGIMLYNLGLDNNFAPFLNPGVHWEKKSRRAENRGLADEVNPDGPPNEQGVPQPVVVQTAAQRCRTLEMLLNSIANYAPVISRDTIVKSSTCLDDIWHALRTHYGFQTSGAHFLDLQDISLDTGERHEALFQRLTSFFEDNLISADSGITHHSIEIDEDEEMSPIIKNTIVFLWLSLIHRKLPKLVKQRYDPNLKSRTLASVKNEISSAIPSLLDEINAQTDIAPVLRTYSSPPNNSSSNNYSNRRSFRPSRSNFSRSSSSRQPLPKNSPSCALCKQASRPSNHFLSTCNYLPEKDKQFISRARLLAALDEEDAAEYYHENAEDCPDDFPIEDVPKISRRVTTCPSPYLNVFYGHEPLRLTLDTGATVNMIHLNLVRQLNLQISPSSQIATQADGRSEIEIVGETRFSVTRDDRVLHFEGLIAKKMDTDVLAGIPFISKNNISIHPASNLVRVDDIPYRYGSTSAVKSTICRIQSHTARSYGPSQTVWPGEYVETLCDIDPNGDTTVAVEPHIDSKLEIAPHITTCLNGKLRLINSTSLPITIKRNQHIAVVSRVMDTSNDILHCPTQSIPEVSASPPNTDLISVNPDNMAEAKAHEQSFHDINQRFDHVFASSFPGYNGKAGPLKATVNVSDALPPQRKGRIPQYSRDKLQLLQDHFDELERVGVFSKPEDVGVNVEYVNPSFLVKKPNNTFRLVTSFGEVAKYCKPAPSLMPNVDSTLRLIGQWKFIIKADLAKAYYQIPLDKASQRFCGVVTPFRGMRVYQRSAMGMPGSESTLEELMCRLLGDLIADGKVTKIADDLYCGANSIEDLHKIWSQILQIFSDCDIRISPSKTVILPRSTTILGWIWNEGTLSASPHQISALQQCDLPRTVKVYRSFLGAYKAIAKVIQSCSKYLSPLESLVAGKASAD